MTAEIDPAERGRVLVIGYGFIGRHVAERCVADRPVTILSRSVDERSRSGRRWRALAGDCRDGEAVRDAMTDVSHVMYCAGGLMPAESNREPAKDIRLSLEPVVTMLEQLRLTPDIRLTFLSSGGTVYGNPASLPVAETAPTDPITSYGVLKVAAEHFIRMYAHQYGISADILRTANVYGPGQPGDRSQGAVAAFAQRLVEGLPITIVGDGNQVRDYVYVSDVVDAALRLAETPASGVRTFNVGSGIGSTLWDVVAELEAAHGRSAVIQRLPSRAFDVRSIVLDITRLRRRIQYEPVLLADGIRRMTRATAVAAR